MKKLILIISMLLLVWIVRADVPSFLGQPATASTTVYLPAVFNTAGTSAPIFDMADYMIGDGRLYEVRHNSGSQARHQTQTLFERFFHTKGNEISAEWEELWIRGDKVYRGTDTSPGKNQYYTLYELGIPGSAWSPRRWRVGDMFERNPYVVFYDKGSCQIVASGFQRSWLRFEGYYPVYTFGSGLRLNNVVELTWLLSPNGQPIESYFYAASYGLVGWGSSDRGYSYINEIHAPGQRPNNKRETIHCLNMQFSFLRMSPELNFGPLPSGYRAK